MDRCSAFGKEICHKGQHIPLDPPIVHMSVYTKGGLQRLFRQIAHPEKVSFPMYEYGQFTDESGRFCPVLGVVMASRYRVRQVISRQGQSAILLLAEDLFCHKKHVVIKVLHASRYQLGAQETQCLWRLALADPAGNSNTVHYLNTFTFDDHYCIVFRPLVPLSLTEIFQDIPAQKVIHSIRKIAVRLLSTLGFLRQQNVIHADLKPENILLHDRNDLSSVTVIDFGNAIQHVHKEIALYYDDFELQTPLYRAPEVMFGMPFGKEIDMWSLGCILAELYLSKPLFMGNSKIDIMQQITSLLGPFPGRTFQRGKFYSSYRHLTDTVEQPDATELLLRHLGCRDYLLADFLAGLLRYNPDERMTPYEAAKHSFLAPEFPFGYLLPPSSGDGGTSYCAVHLTDAKYKHRPVVAPDIRRSQPSTYDILSLGTALKEEDEESPTEAGDTPNKHGRVAKVVPVQREPSLDTVQRYAGEVTRQQNSARNQSSIDATQRGFSHIHFQKENKKNVQRNWSPILTKDSTLDKTTVQRYQNEQKHQGEITQSSERQRERYQKHSSVKNRREITEKESSAVHRSNDHYESARLTGNSPNDRCNQLLCEKLGTEPGRVETVRPGSPSRLRARKARGIAIRMKRDNNVSGQSAGERKQEERSPLQASSLKGEQWSRTDHKLQFIKDINRSAKEESCQEPDNQTDRSDGESDQFQLTREDELPPSKRYHRGREVTPNGHLVQATSRKADSNRRCNHQNVKKTRRLSRPDSVSTDMNETFVIDSDSSSPGRSYLQNKTQRQTPNDQKYEIIRPRPGWFPRKGDGDTYPDSKSEEHISVRYNLYQKPTAVSVSNESQDFLNLDAEHVSDKSDNSVINKYVDCLPEINTESQDWRRDHMKQSKRLDIHGNMKQKGHFCEMSPGYTKEKPLHIPQSPSSLSQESLMNCQSDSERQQCHQKSPRQPAQNASQLASLMNAIREEQDRAEHDLSEKESDRQFKFEVDKRTSRYEIKSSSGEQRLSENCMSTSKMYESVSEDDFQSFDEVKPDDIKTKTDQNSGYASSDSASEACVRPLKGFPTYNNSEKRQGYYEQNRNPKLSTHLFSNANGKGGKSFKTDGISRCRVKHGEKEHFYDSSPAQVSASRQNSACEEDNTGHVIYRPINQKSAYAQDFSSEIPAVSAEEIKLSKSQVTCESGSRRRSGTHSDDLYDCQYNRTSNQVCNNILEKRDSKEMTKYGKKDQNQSKMDGETPDSKKRYRKTFNLRYRDTPDKLSDGDVLRNECSVTASQNGLSNNDMGTDSETRYLMSASTESAIVTRSNNKAEVAKPATDSIATYSHTSSRIQGSKLLEPDSFKQILQSKVQVKKVAKKKLNFTQALKPLKNNKSKIKVLSKSRLTPITIQHSNKQVKKLRTMGTGDDPYVFLITPEKNISNHSEGNTVKISSGGKKSKQKFSKFVSDTRKKGRNKSSQIDLEDNPSQDLDKEPRTHRTKGCLDEKEPIKYCRTKGHLDEKESKQSRQEQTQGIKKTRSKEKQTEEIREEKLLQLSVNKSHKESKNGNFFNCQATEMSIMNGEMQQPVSGEEKNGQKQKRKAASILRSDMKRQKQSDNLDPGCTSSVDLGRSRNRNDIGMKNSSDRYTVRGRNKTDEAFCESDEDCEGTGKSGYGAVEHYIRDEITKSGNYTTERTKTGDYNLQSKDREERDGIESWQSSVSQSSVYQSGQSESQKVDKSSNHPYLPGKSESQNVVNSSNHRHKSSRKSHPAGHQLTTSVGINDGRKHLTKTSNLVAIGKSRRTIHTQGHTLVNKIAQNKNHSPHKFKSANYSEDATELHHFGQRDRVYRQAAVTGTVFQRGDVHKLNEMSSDCSLEEGACEEGAEFYSSDSEEVMLV